MSAPGLTIKFTGLDLSKLRQYAQDVQDGVNDDMNATAIDIEAEQKALAPVDLGNLRANIAAVNDGLHITNRSGAEYSAYVAFSTGTFVDIPNVGENTAELTEYAMQFKGAGIRQVNLPARDFFFGPLYRNWVELQKRIAKTMQDSAAK